MGTGEPVESLTVAVAVAGVAEVTVELDSARLIVGATMGADADPPGTFGVPPNGPVPALPPPPPQAARPNATSHTNVCRSIFIL